MPNPVKLTFQMSYPEDIMGLLRLMIHIS